MKIANRLRGLTILALSIILTTSCNKFFQGQPTAENPGEASTATGLAYNEDGGFPVNDFSGQPDGPNLVFIEGGRMTLGSFEEDLLTTLSLIHI